MSITPSHHRVLAIVTHKVIRSDGQGRVNVEIAFGLARRGWGIDVISGEIDPELAALPGVRWHRVSTPRRLPTAFLRYQWFAIAARRALARLPRVDLLQLNGAIVYGGQGGVNIANFVHSDWLESPFHPRHGRWNLNALYQSLFTRLNAVWEKRAFARAECVVAVSGYVRDALIAQAGVPAGRIEVIPPGVDTDQFRPLKPGELNSLRIELSIPADHFVMMFVGDIRSNRKNLDLVLKSLVDCHQNTHLAVVGDTARSPYLKLVDDLGLGERVHFLGRRTTDLPALLRGADAFVFPSHYDPFALVVTEAMASGLPVITTRTVGASFLIRNGENGIVLDVADAVAPLARAIEDLHLDADLRHKMGCKARKSAKAHSWDAMAEVYDALYRKVIANRR